MAQIKEFPSLKESVLDRIRRDIITCRLKPGEAIRDTNLAARYGVSTSPIREALVHLASERLIDMPPNRSKIVTPIDPKEAIEFFAIFKVVTLSTFSWAAPKISTRELDLMASALAQLKRPENANDGYAYLTHSNNFFLTAYEAAGNAEAMDIIRRCLHRIERIILICGKPNSNVKIQMMFDHLVAGDFTAAIRVHFDILDELGHTIAGLEAHLTPPQKQERARRSRRQAR